ncbi:beta strand repeat-containing protein, partial [Cysteiniphilum marinum]
NTITLAQLVAGELIFEPVADENGTPYTSFSFTVNDGVDNSNIATMTIDVTSVNDAPTLTSFADAIVSTNEDTEVEITLAQLLAQGNEADIDGTVDGFVVQALTSGTLKIGATQATAIAFAVGTNDTIDATNKAYWTPALNANGDTIAAFTVKAQDNEGLLSATAVQATVDVVAVNDAPVAANSTITTNEDTNHTFSAANFSFTDVENDALSLVTITSLPANGTLKVNGSAVVLGTNNTVTLAQLTAGELVFEPVVDANGSPYTSFNFTVNDGVDNSNAATMTIDVTSVNDAPTLTSFADAIVSTNEDTEVEITLAQLLAQGNEADIDGTVDGFVVQALTSGALKIGATQATATAFVAGTNDTIDATNKAYWTPALNVNGNTIAAFTVKAQDNEGLLSPTAVQVSVDILPVNDLPQGQLAFTGSFQQGQTISADISQITDVDGLGAVTYQWQRNGQNIVGSTAASYVLSSADVGTVISVVASYTDSDGTLETIVGHTPHIANASGVVEIDADNDGTVDVIGVVGDTALDNGDGTYTFISGTTPEVQVTLPVADNTNQTTQIAVSNGVASIDLGNNGQIDVNVPSNTTVTPNPSDSTVTVRDNASSGNVTVPADSNTIIEFNSNGTADIDIGGDGNNDVTVPTDEDITITTTPDNTLDIDIGSDGNNDVTVPTDEDITITTNSDNTLDIDIGSDGNNDVTVPTDEDITIITNPDNTLDIDIGSDGNNDVTVPTDEDITITTNPDNTLDIDIGSDGNNDVTVPTDEDITITTNPDNTLDIDIGSDGNNDVTVPTDEDITITTNPDNTLDIDIGSDGNNDITVPTDEDITVTTNPDNTIDIDIGSDGNNDITLPSDEDITITTNPDNTIDIDIGSDGNNDVTVPTDEDITVTTNPDNTIDIDIGSDGNNDVTVPTDEDITITTNPDNTLDIDIGSDGNNDITLPNDKGITVTPNSDGTLALDIGGNGTIDVVVPRGAKIDILNNRDIRITTKTGQQYIAGRGSNTTILADSVNVYTNAVKEKITASSGQSGYVISGRSALSDTQAFIADGPLRFEEAFSGFENNTIFTIPVTFTGTGDGSIDAPLSVISKFSQPIKVGSLLSSDEISAVVEGLDANEGTIEVERLGNKVDIYFRPDSAFSGKADFSLKIYQGGVLYDEKHFEVEISARADVIATNAMRIDVANISVESREYSADNTITTQGKEEAQEQVKEQAKVKPDSRERINIARSEFKEALDQGKAVEQLSDIVKNTLQLAIETNSVSNIATVASEMLKVSLQAEKSPSLVVKNVFEQTLDSNMTNSDIAFVLSKMILESDEDKQNKVIQAIVAEPKLNAEHIANMYDYLQAQDPELAEAFANEIKQSKDENTVNNAANISDALNVELQEYPLKGLLAKLKAKIFGDADIDDNTTEYSEVKHRHKLSVAKSNLLELGNKQNNKNSKG